ncbi:MAG: cysteine dioxygenase family protein [Terriglobia bacterium]
MAKTAGQQVGIEEFVQGLKGLPEFIPPLVNAFLKEHRVQPDSLQPYIFFNSGSYTRNLIFKNELFELLALCWDVGQVSRIHNHRDQQCWMAVALGKLENQNYRVFDHSAEKLTCRLEPSASCLITPESPLEVDAEEPVHQVLNQAEYGARAVSLHIYSRPFDTCEVYSLESGSYCDVPLFYTSMYGKLCQEEQTGTAR